MVSENLLSSYIGLEVVLRLPEKKYVIGILEKNDRNSVTLIQDGGKTKKVEISQIKGIEKKPEGHGDFERKVNSIIASMIHKGEASSEKEALEKMKKKLI
ncbi:MAG: hypothetical protein M1433_01270 [Candidatus Parvarchaeota archaeon]|nr:hypothetical protein [Candidatus Parvarchaeota archaeon]